MEYNCTSVGLAFDRVFSDLHFIRWSSHVEKADSNKKIRRDNRGILNLSYAIDERMTKLPGP